MSVNPLLTQALLGTERHPELPPPPAAVPQESWQKLEGLPPAKRLLHAAALLDIAQSAGQPAREDLLAPAAAPPETRSYPPSSFRAPLLEMLREVHRSCLPEWLEICSDQQWLIPPDLLPQLLDAAQRERSLRESVQDCAGRRGPWLARTRNLWPWLTESLEEGSANWETGTDAQRLRWYASTRKSDPEKAIAALQKDWKKDSPDFRQHLVELIQLAPLPQEEASLQKMALRDRRAATRLAAQLALWKLPDSAFCKRHQQRICQVLHLQNKRNSTELCILLPEEFPKDWSLDGLQSKPPSGKGEKAFWVEQILGLASLQDWAAALNIGPEEFVQLAWDPEWAALLLNAVLLSLTNHPDPDFVVQMLPALLSQAQQQKRRDVVEPLLNGVNTDKLTDLLEQLTLRPEEREKLLHTQSCRVHHERHPKLFALLKEVIRSPHGVSAHFARCLAPESIPFLLSYMATLPQLTPSAERLAHTLEFRQRYLQHLPSFETGTPS